MELKCPCCGTVGLGRTDEGWECPTCGRAYSIVRRVSRFVDTQIYSGSFGFQWNRFAKTQLDSANGTTRSLDTFVEKTGWDTSQLDGARVLDAGCGMGRFAEVCAQAGAEVHAVDLSEAVEAASANLRSHANAHVYQADIMALPFPEKSFDYIYSIGVLHHTPDTERAFQQLVPLLKPGGEIAIWVYEKRWWWFTSDLLRLLTSRMPKRFLLSMCRIAVPLYWVHRLPMLGLVTRTLLPTSMESDPEWRWLDTFDWYSPLYQWKHTGSEVREWCRSAGLEVVETGPIPVSVRAVRPESEAGSSDRQSPMER